MILPIFTLLGLCHVASTSAIEIDRDSNKRSQMSAFDTLGGMGLGKRADLSSFDTLGGMGLGKRADLSSFDTLGGMGLGKRAPQFSGFDTLGGMGLGKRSAKPIPASNGDKRALSTFDSLGGMGLGKRSLGLIYSRPNIMQQYETGIDFGRQYIVY